MKFIDPKSGWKTYVVVIVGVGLGVAQYFGVHIPSYVDWGLTFLGMGALRNGMKVQSATTAAAVADLAKLILENVTVPDPNEGATAMKTEYVHTEYLPPLK